MNFIVSFFIILLSNTVSAQSWSSIYQQSQKSIPVIVSAGMTCSGALIEKNLILTSAHCVDRYRSLSVYFKMKDWIKLNARRVQVVEKSDLALLEIDQDLSLPLLPLFSRSESIQVGQAIATIGHPIGGVHLKVDSLLNSDYVHVISSGLISKVGSNGFVSDASVSPGNSGGPVLNQKGEIVGVVSKKRIDRYSGDLAYFSSHNQIHQIIDHFKTKKNHQESFLNARTTADLYLTYSQPDYRKNRQGEAKTYWSIGVGIQFWDRLRLTMDTNLDTKEAFTQYGLGWNFILSTQDPMVFYKIIPSVEVIKFRFKDELQNNETIEKFAPAIALTFKPSWFPFFIKASGFRIDQKDYSLVGLGLQF